MRTLVVGAGKAGVCALYLLQDLALDLNFRLRSAIVDYSSHAVSVVRALGIADIVGQCDARDAVALKRVALGEHDLVINVVNVPDTEQPTVYVTVEGGTVLWFSMATRFDRAALATDALGKDVTMIVGNGFAQGQCEMTAALMKAHAPLRALFQEHGDSKL